MDDDEIRTLVARLGRAHRSGGRVIERAAIVAAGADSDAIVRWILAHGGQPEAAAAASAKHGLHGSLHHPGDAPGDRPPARFVLPAAE